MIFQNRHFQVQKFSQKNLPKYLLQFSMNANKHPKYSIDTLQFPKPSFSGSKIFTKISSQMFLAVLYRCKQTSQILHRYSSIPKILIFRFNIFSPQFSKVFTKRKTFPPESFPQSSTDATRSVEISISNIPVNILTWHDS